MAVLVLRGNLYILMGGGHGKEQRGRHCQFWS